MAASEPSDATAPAQTSEWAAPDATAAAPPMPTTATSPLELQYRMHSLMTQLQGVMTQMQQRPPQSPLTSAPVAAASAAAQAAVGGGAAEALSAGGGQRGASPIDDEMAHLLPPGIDSRSAGNSPPNTDYPGPEIAWGAPPPPPPLPPPLPSASGTQGHPFSSGRGIGGRGGGGGGFAPFGHGAHFDHYIQPDTFGTQHGFLPQQQQGGAFPGHFGVNVGGHQAGFNDFFLPHHRGGGGGGRGGYQQRGRGGHHGGRGGGGGMHGNHHPRGGISSAFGFGHISAMMAPASDGRCQAVVEFKRQRVKKYDAPPTIQPGQYVIVDGDRGQDCGLVVQLITQLDNGTVNVQSMEGTAVAHQKLKLESGRVVRAAESSEIAALHGEIATLERQALKTCRERCDELGIGIEVIDCEYQFDRKKVSFFFNSEHSVDFRELVRDLYKVFGARIWMENVNPNVKNTVPQGALSQHQKNAMGRLGAPQL